MLERESVISAVDPRSQHIAIDVVGALAEREARAFICSLIIANIRSYM